MAVSLLIFRHAYTSGFNKLMDIDSDTFKCSLHTSTFTPSQDANDFFNDATNELAASGNYTAGGATISPGVVSTATTKQYNVDFGADQTVSGATFTIQWAAPLPGGVASFSVT